MQIQTLKEDDLELFYKHAKEEKWDIEDSHIRALLQTYPDDFFIVYKDLELLGYVVALKESEEFGFISSLLVLKHFRSLSFGKQIFTFALEHLGDKQIALDSVLGQESFYEQFGFKHYFDVNTYKFITGTISLDTSSFNIINFDEKLSQPTLTPYLKELFKDKSVSYKAIKDKEAISSFAFSFAYKDGYKITINTQDIDHGVALFFALCQQYKMNTPIYIQTAKTDSLLEALAEALQMQKVLHSSRMYNKILAG